MDIARKASDYRIYIPAMDCPDEEKEVRAALRRVPGVESLTFHLFSRQVVVRHRGGLSELLEVLNSIGMEGRPVDESLRKADIPEPSKGPLVSFLLSAVLLSAGVLSRVLAQDGSLSNGLLLAAAIAGGFQVAIRGLREVRNRSLGMNALMTISITGAAVMGDLAEAAVVVTLFALANHLEAGSLDRARRATAALFSVSPEKAVIRVGGPEGREMTVAAEDVREGDVVIVRPGERVPVDAVVFKGASDLNEAMITGESIPVRREEGDPLYAGTVNGQGLLLARALRSLNESTCARILRRVEEAQTRKADIQTFMEKFAGFYTPGVLSAAVLVAFLPPLLGLGGFSAWVYRALVLLVIACPCAIVLAAPVATVSALTRATREGILVKGARYLEALGTTRAVAFDKTGTLTRGKLKVTRIRAAEGIREEEVLRLAGAVESGSSHPAAEAIRHEARRRGVAQAARGTLARTFETLEGRGVSAEVEGIRVYVGNRKLFEEIGAGPGSLDAILPLGTVSANSAVTIVGTARGPAGSLEMQDELREEAPDVVRELADLGIPSVVMLSGDRRDVALTVGEAAGIREVYAELLPEEKLAKVRELVGRYGTVTMVGDGVNDAPALAQASVGIAMGAAGSPAAIETADVALMAEDLRKIPAAIRLGRRMVAVIRQNVAASLAIKAFFLATAVAGYATLWMAVVADMGTTLLVIGNGLRLARNGGPSG
jgi:Cd2+/Zn2+-exporting ATPase